MKYWSFEMNEAIYKECMKKLHNRTLDFGQGEWKIISPGNWSSYPLIQNLPMYIHIFYVGSYRHMFVYVQLTEDKKERDRNEIEREGAGLLYGTYCREVHFIYKSETSFFNKLEIWHDHNFYMFQFWMMI